MEDTTLEETEALMSDIVRLKDQGRTILLIEHDQHGIVVHGARQAQTLTLTTG